MPTSSSKSVMVGLAFASLVTWTILFVKDSRIVGGSAHELRRSLVRARRSSDSLGEAVDATETAEGRHRRDPARSAAALAEGRALARARPAEGVKERATALLSRIEARAGRSMARGTGLLATIGSTAPFVGLFGTVWGIMNSLHRYFENQHDQSRGRCARHRGGLACHRHSASSPQFRRSSSTICSRAGSPGTAQILGDASTEVLRLLVARP